MLFIVFQSIYSSNTKSMNTLISKIALEKALAITKLKMFVSVTDDYIDIYRVKAYLELKETYPQIEKSLKDKLSYAEIKLFLLDDNLNPVQDYLIYNMSPKDNKDYLVFRFQLPVLIYNATQEKSKLGVLNISIFER